MKILMLVAIKSVYIRKGLDSLVSISDLVSTFSSIRFFLPSFLQDWKKIWLDMYCKNLYLVKSYLSEPML